MIDKYGIEICLTEVEAGSGSLPLEKLPSVAIVIKDGMKANELSKFFRMASTPLLGFIHGKNFYVDFKAILPEQEKNVTYLFQEILI